MILVSKNNLIFAQKEKLSCESTPEIKVESFRMAFLIQIKYVNIKKKLLNSEFIQAKNPEQSSWNEENKPSKILQEQKF